MTILVNMKLLVIEDDVKIANAIKQGMRQQKFAVDIAYDGDTGLAMATSDDYDAIILDRMLPGSIDGIGILKHMRSSNIHTPVLMLTAKDKILDKAFGLNIGADDYLVKPFAFVELIARIRALLRRPSASLGNVLTYEDVQLNTETSMVTRQNSEITLSATEFSLLEYFMRNPGRTIAKEELMQRVWDYDSDILPNTVEVYVGYLRNKIDKPFNSSLLQTRRGFGYKFGNTS